MKSSLLPQKIGAIGVTSQKLWYFSCNVAMLKSVWQRPPWLGQRPPPGKLVKRSKSSAAIAAHQAAIAARVGFDSEISCFPSLSFCYLFRIDS